MTPIPVHLAAYPWYALHQAWLRERDIQTRHDPGSGSPARAILTGAILTGANLTFADLARADLTGADLTGADLTGADLAGADLTGADLAGADLTRANLARANLTDARGLPSAPTVPHLHAAILDALKHGGVLRMRDWHTCETTHCRAGWAITLAGEAGMRLEREIGPCAAGALISLASCPQLNGLVPDFLATDKDALADIRRLAELEHAAAE